MRGRRADLQHHVGGRSACSSAPSPTRCPRSRWTRLIQRDVAETLRSSAFARSETFLQLAWVLGAAIGVVLPSTGTMDAAVTFWIAAAVVGVVGALVALRERALRRGLPNRRTRSAPIQPRRSSVVVGTAALMSGLLVVTAVAAERAAIADACPGLAVLVAGVGPAAAAAVTSAALAREPVRLGALRRYRRRIRPARGSGTSRWPPRSCSPISAPQSADGFVPLSELGFGDERYRGTRAARRRARRPHRRAHGHRAHRRHRHRHGGAGRASCAAGSPTRSPRAWRAPAWPPPPRCTASRSPRSGRSAMRSDHASARSGGWPRRCDALGRAVAAVRGWRGVKLAYSPCPNDTFVFHAWTHGLLRRHPPVEVTFADIDVTNTAAEQGAFRRRQGVLRRAALAARRLHPAAERRRAGPRLRPAAC